jgi:transposase
MTMLTEEVDVVIGVDTHKHSHSAAVVVARTGIKVGELTVDADPSGYMRLMELAKEHGALRAWAIEGTGSYGAGLNRFLCKAGERIIEIERPKRPQRHGGEKSDPIDALRAAREALGREQLGEPRAAGERAALSVLMVARRSAVDASTTAQLQLHAIVVTAPEALRCRFRARSTIQMVQLASRLRVDDRWDLETKTTARAMRSLARRAHDLNAEASAHEKEILAVVRAWRPDLLSQFGVGPIVAATILCAWSHPGRCRSEAAFAKLGGVAPLPASSGLTVRHRLSRYGDRQLNKALYTVVLSRLRYDPVTRAYAETRTKEGKSPREIKRCLKRYVARQLYRQLENPPLSS